MVRILLIAGNVVRGIMSRQALYVWGAAVLLMFLRSSQALFMRGEPEFLAFVRASAVSGAIEVWAMLCVGAAVLIGAGSISGEITTKTIVTVLARPVRRWELLVGKWIGVSFFCLLSLAIGVALDMLIAAYLGIDVRRSVLAIAIAQTAAAIVLFGGFAVALSAFGSSVLAVAITVLLMFMPGLIEVLKMEPGRTPRAIGAALDYATPPGYDSQYRGVAWAQPPLRPGARVPAALREPPGIDYTAQRTIVAKNTGYAVLYVLLGCVVFSRRDMKLS